MSNTTTSNATGVFGLTGLGNAPASYYNQLAAQQSQLYQYPMQYATTQVWPSVATPPPAEKEITVPVLEVSDYKGIFLRDKDGKLMHVSAERVYKALGFEW